MRVCKNHTCGIDISHKKSHAQYCSRSCKEVEASRRNYEKKEARRKQWRLENPDKVQEYKKKTKSRFGAAYSAKRRISVNTATHDKEALKAMSALACRLNNLTNSELQVDHIEPIVHSEVCGLNSAANIQLLSGPINRAKSNRRDYLTPLEKIYDNKTPTNYRRYSQGTSFQ